MTRRLFWALKISKKFFLDPKKLWLNCTVYESCHGPNFWWNQKISAPIRQKIALRLFWALKFLKKVIPSLSYGQSKFSPKLGEFGPVFTFIVPNLSTLHAEIWIMVQQVRLMLFSLNMLDCSMSFHSLFTCIFFNNKFVGLFWCGPGQVPGQVQKVLRPRPGLNTRLSRSVPGPGPKSGPGQVPGQV